MLAVEGVINIYNIMDPVWPFNSFIVLSCFLRSTLSMLYSLVFIHLFICIYYYVLHLLLYL